MEEYSATDDDYGRVVAKNYDAASENPYAYRRTPYSVDDVLESSMVV